TLPTAVLPAVLPVGDRWLDRGVLTGAAAVLVGAAALLLTRRGTGTDARRGGAALAVLLAALALLGPGRRGFTEAVATAPGTAALVEPWALAAGALLVAAAAAGRRSWPGRGPALVVALAPWCVLAVVALPPLLTTVAASNAAEAGTVSAAVRLGLLGAVGVAAALLGAGRAVRVAPSRPTGPGVPSPAPLLSDLGLALAAGSAAVATAVVPPHLVDAPVAAVAVTAFAAAVLAARGPAGAPVRWLALGALALAPSLVVRTGDLRPVAWTTGAVLLLALAHAARRPPRPRDDAPDPTRPAGPRGRPPRAGAGVGAAPAPGG
ncbi:hypothetical protein AB6N23_18460, partial [Cellulomonas sp. 179-A 9B4 NHS]